MYMCKLYISTHRLVCSEDPSTLGSGDGDGLGGHVGVDDWLGHEHVDVIVEVGVNILLKNGERGMENGE